ncbi:FHA domain-containing protein [Stigmatella aurantiaca]|uniref:Conserved uncharacterized protein n=1 Tax=Stigmatella aurantiaca (strain DW4/3-1) TaxID=378806 RepID=Q09AS1_STIAD|nr:FHA domain-containing protein [Stigmatella aurantiaca]ADO74849.1 conserved uncharacterized protein [Stigmatella aurantiaca DW4/3-1]EAU68811.1 FHA domain protein [Stigmatella aurantiaca DW4/3-1]
MARSLLLSLLVRQHMALKARFQARYPHPWLIWEAGAWNVPETGVQNVAATQLPAQDLRDCLPAGDALCFELPPPSPPQSVLRLGRASNNELVINDATVSREHITLSLDAEGQWRVEALSKAGLVKLDGVLLQPGRPTPLKPETHLELGDARLTFHGPEDFSARLGRIAARLAEQMSRAV